MFENALLCGDFLNFRLSPLIYIFEANAPNGKGEAFWYTLYLGG